MNALITGGIASIVKEPLVPLLLTCSGYGDTNPNSGFDSCCILLLRPNS